MNWEERALMHVSKHQMSSEVFGCGQLMRRAHEMFVVYKSRRVRVFTPTHSKNDD